MLVECCAKDSFGMGKVSGVAVVDASKSKLIDAICSGGHHSILFQDVERFRMLPLTSQKSRQRQAFFRTGLGVFAIELVSAAPARGPILRVGTLFDFGRRFETVRATVPRPICAFSPFRFTDLRL